MMQIEGDMMTGEVDGVNLSSEGNDDNGEVVNDKNKNGNKPPAISAVLGYWDIRGLAQPVRFLLAHLGVEYEEKTYGGRGNSAEDW